MSSLKLPPNAPFSGAQKMWLKGFLDGISSAFPPATTHPAAPPAASLPAPSAPGLPVNILWGSQTGNSEALAKKLAKSLNTQGHSPTVHDMAEVSPTDLTNYRNLLIITSTYGDGEPPDNAAALHAALATPGAPPLTSVNFAILALGDSNYPDFCQCGHDFQTRLATLGATPMLAVHEADGDFDAPFATWSAQVGQCLSARATA